MIRRVRLEHWRAYESLDLTLTRPVTFLVAPNGVGKSSFVDAVRWGLLGTPVDRARGRSVRTGHDAASVTVWLDLAEHGEVEVTRTIRRSGASTFNATLRSDKLDQGQYEVLLADAWSAEPALLDSVVFGPANTAKLTGFPIRDHLAAVFGVEPLLRAADTVKARRDAIDGQIRSLRQEYAVSADAIASTRDSVADLRAVVDDARERRDSADETLRISQRAASQAAAWETFRLRATEYRAQAGQLIAEMASVLGGPAGQWQESPRTALVAAQNRASQDLEEQLAASADARLQAARAASAVDLLDVSADRCPTCLRPLSEADKLEALTAHGHVSVNAGKDSTRHEQQIVAGRAQLAEIGKFNAAMAELVVPVEPAHDDPGADAEEVLANARTQAAARAQELGEATERLRAQQSMLTDLQQASSEQRRLTLLAKQDALLEVAQRSLTATADRYLAERVEPLTVEIAHRWKLLFGSEGLHLSSDGQLRLTHADVDVALADMSGGERASALLITRVMLAAAATKASTLWFDEPLEHLDPARRAAVAQTLVRAAQGGAVGQIVITTYEEGLARRLQATADETVAVVYARTTAAEAV